MSGIKSITIGLAIGFVMTTFFVTVFNGFNEITTQLIAWCIASALYGLTAMIMRLSEKNILLVSTLHFLACFAITLVMAILFYKEVLIYVIGYFIISYIVIMLSIIISDKIKTKKINEKLSGKHN